MFHRNCWIGPQKRLHSPWIAAWKRDLHNSATLSGNISHICIPSDDEIETVRRDDQHHDSFINEVNIGDQSKEDIILEHMSPVKMMSHESIRNEIAINTNETFGNFLEEMELEEYFAEDIPDRKKKVTIDRYKSFSSNYVQLRYKTGEIKFQAKKTQPINILKRKKLFSFPSMSKSDKNIDRQILNNFVRNIVNIKKKRISPDSHEKRLTYQVHGDISILRNIDDKLQGKEDIIHDNILNEISGNWLGDNINPGGRNLNECRDTMEFEADGIVTSQINMSQDVKQTKNHTTLCIYFPKYLCDLHLEDAIISSKFNSDQLIGRSYNALKNKTWNYEIIERPFNWRREWKDVDILKNLNTLWLEKKKVTFEDIYKLSPNNEKAIRAANTLSALIKFRMNNIIVYTKNQDGHITNIIPRPSYLKTKSKYRKFSIIQ
ncbi:uncharacterized protein LOC143919281 isoform X2 [Arctopsyche grandis]|uniref:uncharacterized protein LOC143919281 isoform X2 n=1 Tax=Arctopsyche grandis TaxID=121162 RepID=UPI00406D759E